MWDCNNGSGGNRVPTLGPSVSYDTIFPRGDSEMLSPLSGYFNKPKRDTFLCCIRNYSPTLLIKVEDQTLGIKNILAFLAEYLPKAETAF